MVRVVSIAPCLSTENEYDRLLYSANKFFSNKVQTSVRERAIWRWFVKEHINKRGNWARVKFVGGQAPTTAQGCLESTNNWFKRQFGAYTGTQPFDTSYEKAIKFATLHSLKADVSFFSNVTHLIFIYYI